jgi:ATP-binding cassette subfamily B protein RaxB
MSIDLLKFSRKKKPPLLYQAESAECGLVCLGMIAGFHGLDIELSRLRQMFDVSLKGATLANLMSSAKKLNLSARALRLESEEAHSLKLPAILHWNFNHFVVLSKISRGKYYLHDPASGLRVVSSEQMRESFTGVALELWPTPSFVAKSLRHTPSLWGLMGTVRGVGQAAWQLLCVSFAIEALVLVSPFFIQWVIDHVLVANDKDLLVIMTAGFLVVTLSQQALRALRSYMVMYYSVTLALQWKENLFSHLLKLPLRYFYSRHVGDVLARFGAVDSIQSTLTTSFTTVIIDGVMALLVLVLMFVYAPSLTVVSLLALSCYGLSRWGWYLPLRRASQEQVVNSARQQSHFLETLRAVRTIKLFSRQEQRRSQWIRLLVNQINAGVAVQKLQVGFQLINACIFGVEGVLAVYLGANMVLHGGFTVGALMAYLAYKGQFTLRVSSLIDRSIEFKMLHLQGEMLGDIVLSPAERIAAAPNLDLLRDTAISLEVKNLSFRHSESEPDILSGISFCVAGRESVCIVGSSGCGKSTLLGVLMGIYSAQHGSITVDGREVSTEHLLALREHMAVVMQDDTLLSGSIQENISFFDEEVDMDWVMECARTAAIHEEIMQMPMAYNTLVGDMGGVLSGGQKQRVLLARALYTRPRLLILDEATSHLDPVTESIVNNNIKTIQITRISVAHRLETILQSEKVIKLENGKVKFVMSSADYRQSLATAGLQGDACAL